MFRIRPEKSEATYRLAIICLLSLSLLALAISIWVLLEFSREQSLVSDLMKRLPPDATMSAEKLAGELRWQFRLTPLIVLNSVVSFVAMVLLWRAYRSSQDSLRDVRALAGDILSSVDQAIITTDASGTITSINRRGIELLALNEDVVGKHLNDLSAKLPLEPFRRRLRQEPTAEQQEDFRSADNGAERTLRAQCQRLTNWQDDDIGNVLQLRDVTEQHWIEARMRRMERFMGLGSLAAGLHHEIKNPLAAVMLHVQLLEEHLDEETVDSETAEMVDVIKVELHRIGRVLEGFRDFASGDQLNLTEVDLRELVEHQVALIEPRASAMDVTVQLDLAEHLPTIPGDQPQLEQVFVNLFVNALEAMPDGGSLTIACTVDEAKRALLIRVSDTGHGIPAELREEIFNPYFSTKPDGTGMGLAFCDKIVRQHQGHLDMKSDSSGTVCEITLPLAVREVSYE